MVWRLLIKMAFAKFGGDQPPLEALSLATNADHSSGTVRLRIFRSFCDSIVTIFAPT